MPKIPRDISGNDLIKFLQKYHYEETNKVGSHIKLTSNFMGWEHNIIVPMHKNLKIGMLDAVLRRVAEYLDISKKEIIEKLINEL